MKKVGYVSDESAYSNTIMIDAMRHVKDFQAKRVGRQPRVYGDEVPLMVNDKYAVIGMCKKTHLLSCWGNILKNIVSRGCGDTITTIARVLAVALFLYSPSVMASDGECQVYDRYYKNIIFKMRPFSNDQINEALALQSKYHGVMVAEKGVGVYVIFNENVAAPEKQYVCVPNLTQD